MKSQNLLVPIAVAVLAVIAILLVVFALRAPVVAGRGETPGPIPTWDSSLNEGTATPSAEPSPSQSPSSLDDRRLIDAAGTGTLVRSTRGGCGAVPPLAEFSADGGSTWSPISFGSIGIAEVLSVELVSETQIDITAMSAPNCVPTVISSYTSGEFWQEYPERLQEETYALSSGQLFVGGAELDTPCLPVTAKQTAAGTSILCDDGVYTRGAAAAEWTQLAGAVAPLDFDAQGASAVFALSGPPACEGTAVGVVQGAALEIGEQRACVTPGAGPSVAVALSGDISYLWRDDGMFRSTDVGATWTKLGE
jgi:hypothetical protein